MISKFFTLFRVKKAYTMAIVIIGVIMSAPVYAGSGFNIGTIALTVFNIGWLAIVLFGIIMLRWDWKLAFGSILALALVCAVPSLIVYL